MTDELTDDQMSEARAEGVKEYLTAKVQLLDDSVRMVAGALARSEAELARVRHALVEAEGRITRYRDYMHAIVVLDDACEEDVPDDVALVVMEARSVMGCSPSP